MHIHTHASIELVDKLFTNDLRPQGSIPGRVIPTTKNGT